MHLYGRIPWNSRSVGAGRPIPRLFHRQDGGDNGGDQRMVYVAVVIGILFVVLIAIVVWVVVKRRAAQRKHTGDGRYEPATGENRSTQSHQLNSTTRRNGTARTNNRTSNISDTVNRHTSVRSVMTLPAYRPSAANNEQVLGREGDRDGIDVIVDLPNEEDLERQRDQEMEAMYQIRAARREQSSARSERTREQEEAAARRDNAALADIRARTRAASNSHQTQIEELRGDIERLKDARQRSVSSVSYADLGVARHDGTRLRASSNDSERMGLLSDAASFTQSTRSRGHSPGLRHQRNQSVSSVGSFDSDFTAPRRRSSAEDRAGSSPELVEADVGTEAMPPPEYEDVSLNDELDVPPNALVRSTTPMEPPPDYTGPYRSGSQRTDRSSLYGARAEESTARAGGGSPAITLRTHQVPEIVVQPSSAHPDNDGTI
ncbi:hypothetical protein S40285_04324 [Stachybotrys chlorohalonatus IBT 40285]|uniref:Uncharacterized protein n=1 Tax=Stachybotrys chlorohalonatus (strain IBT 40285) TaxID=1283841 RepID=A0A084QNN4_STAC4|nr:hypothetical protein S40285_04324 [Stachybotrys chlorohalonata IBT 40285]